MINATLGMATVARAGSFPEWQDEAEHPRGARPYERDADDSLEEYP